MKHSRRGRIISLLREGKSDSELLTVIDKEFPPGTFLTSNKKALSGVKWDLRLPAALSDRKKTPPF